MVIEKTMLIPLAVLILVMLASGIVIRNQILIQEDHTAMQKELAGIARACHVQASR